MDISSASRTRVVAVLLTLSGGFLDAFTYVGHGRVFANTMTGNVALLGVDAAAGEWAEAGRHIPPLVGFVFAVFIAHMLNLDGVARRVRQPALICLTLEVAFLSIAPIDALTLPELVLIPGISFTATLQTLSFTHLESLSYTSVMTTGNLRRAAAKLFAGLIPRWNSAALGESWLLGMISVSFLAGAALGAFSTSRLHDHALWISALILAMALARIVQLSRRADLIAPASGGPDPDIPPSQSL
jgi:uncharacterized membrane protein YoaK (UPF0700 family)